MFPLLLTFILSVFGFMLKSCFVGGQLDDVIEQKWDGAVEGVSSVFR